jgi:hypothetical protein
MCDLPPTATIYCSRIYKINAVKIRTLKSAKEWLLNEALRCVEKNLLVF